VEAIAFIWLLWLCRNDKMFNDKNSSIFGGYLPVYQYSLFMVISTEGGETKTYLWRSVHGGGYDFSNMDGRIVCA
jgi:hypothetical protein